MNEAGRTGSVRAGDLLPMLGGLGSDGRPTFPVDAEGRVLNLIRAWRPRRLAGDGLGRLAGVSRPANPEIVSAGAQEP